MDWQAGTDLEKGARINSHSDSDDDTAQSESSITKGANDHHGVKSPCQSSFESSLKSYLLSPFRSPARKQPLSLSRRDRTPARETDSEGTSGRNSQLRSAGTSGWGWSGRWGSQWGLQWGSEWSLAASHSDLLFHTAGSPSLAATLPLEPAAVLAAGQSP